MGSPTVDAPAAPDEHALRPRQNEARRTSAAASSTSTAAVDSTADTIAMHNVAGTTGGGGVAAPAAVALTVKSAGAATSDSLAGTAAVAAAAGRKPIAQRKPTGVDRDGAKAAGGARVPRVGAPGAPICIGAPVPLSECLQDANTLAARELCEAKTCALAADAAPAASDSLDGAFLRTSSAEADLPKENNAASAAAALRHTAARQRRNGGRQRAPICFEKGEADEEDSEDPTASVCSVVPIAGSAAAATTRMGGSSTGISKREQEKVRKRYEPLLRETEEALQKVIAQGLPEAETLTHPQVYLELKKTILFEDSPIPGEESTMIAVDEDGEICREAGSENKGVSLSRVKRLLRALCEGSSLPLSKLIEAVRVVLLDETDGAPQETVSPATLQSLIPVLLARRSLGIPPRRAMAAAVAGPSAADAKSNPCAAESKCETVVASAATGVPATAAEATTVTAAGAAGNASPGIRLSSINGDTKAPASDSATRETATTAAVGAAPAEHGLSRVFSSNVGGFDRNEDTTPSCLWMWESAFLEGLPATFKEKAKKDRERRAVVSRRVRSLLRLQQAIEQGNEKEILAAQEKVASLEKKQQQEEERRREQQLKKRRAEEARLEKEREKKQKEDAKKEKEREKKKTEKQQKQAQQQSAGGGGAARSQTVAGARTEKAGSAQKAEKRKELASSVLSQQLLMASWLTRRPLFVFPEKASRTSPLKEDTNDESRSSCHVAHARSSSTVHTSGGGRDTDTGVETNAPEQGLDEKEGGDFAGLTEAGSKPRQAVCSSSVMLGRSADGDCFPWGRTRRRESSTDTEVVEVGGDARTRKEWLEKTAKEAARARAAAEAVLWRVPEGKRHQFVERVLSLPKALVPLPSSSDAHIPFFDGPEDPSASASCDPDKYLKAFVESCAVPHSEAWRDFYSFLGEQCRRSLFHSVPTAALSAAELTINRQYVYRLPPGGGVAQPQLLTNGGSGEGATPAYCQEVREVRKGLVLTDYVDASLPDLQYLRTVVINLDEWKRPVRRLLLGKSAGRSTAWEQCTEESCIDYDRDSDEEWFETFDVDDLDDGREEEEEEDQEADEDKDWLVDDDDDVGGIKAGSVLLSHGVRFESLCDWQWTFEGEDKPNYNDVSDACAVPTLRDPGWLSVYGCVADDWGGEPFAMLKVTVTSARRKLTDEELCGFFRFCHGKIVSKVKLLAHFHRENRHLRKTDLEKKFKEHMAYERRPKDKQKRWYVSRRAAEALNLKEELDAVLAATRDEETLREAAQSLPDDIQEKSAADIAAVAVQHAHPDPSGRGICQARDRDGSANDALDESRLLAGEGSLLRAQSKGGDRKSASDVKFGMDALSCSPTLLTSSSAKDRVSPPSTTNQGSAHDQRVMRPSGVPQSRKSSNSVTCSVPATDSATRNTSKILSASHTSLTDSSSSAECASTVNNRAATQSVTPPVPRCTKKVKAPNPLTEVNGSRFEETDELKVQGAAREVDNNSPGATETPDVIDTVDPFASAAATAARAASSAQAAAAAAYGERPSKFASATCLALAALTAAKLAKEVALQMHGSFQNSKKLNVIVPSSMKFLPSSVCSVIAAPKLPCALGNAFHLQNGGVEESGLSLEDRESSCDAARTESSNSDRITSDTHDQVAITTPINASPSKEVAACCQHHSPTNENTNGSMVDADDAGSNPRNVRKRRRSDSSLRGCDGSADGSVTTSKRTKRPSCPSGTPAASAGSQLKNALITSFFRVVPQAPKRMSNDVKEEIS